jgi:hypothetical protein
MTNQAQDLARMTVPEILKELELYTGRFPKRAMREAVEQREAVTPELLRVLEEVAASPQSFAERKDYMLHLFAMFLLAQFREKRTYRPLVAIFGTPGEVPDRGKLERTFSHAWNGLVTAVADLRAPELLEDVRQAYTDGLGDPSFADLEGIERDVLDPNPRPLRQRPLDYGRHCRDGVVALLPPRGIGDEEAATPDVAAAKCPHHDSHPAREGRPQRAMPVR